MMLVRPSTPQAEMQFKDRWFACLSLGERTYRTETSDQLSLMINSLFLLCIADVLDFLNQLGFRIYKFAFACLIMC